MIMRTAWSILTVACLLFLGCATNRPIPLVEQIPDPLVPAFPSDALQRALILERFIIGLPKDTVLGEMRQGTLCIFPQKLIWRSEDPMTFREGGYHREFERIVVAANFKIPEKPTSLFDPLKLSGTELVISAKVLKIQENICNAVDVFGTRGGIRKGNVRLSIHWEVYSIEVGQVIFRLDNEGTAVDNEFRPFSEDGYYSRAFGNALRGLLSNEAFRRLATLPPRPKIGL